jgi:hypothetical protein
VGVRHGRHPPEGLSRGYSELLGALGSLIMGRKHRESVADEQVASFLRASGFERSTARQSREWRALRLLEPADLVRSGYAQPVLASNRPGTLDRALVVAHAYGGKRVRLERVALRLFARREEVEEHLLRRSLVAAIDYLQDYAKRHAQSDSVEDQVAFLVEYAKSHAKRQPMTSFLLRGSEGLGGESANAIFESVIELAFTALLGGDVRAFEHPTYEGGDSMDELLRASGAIGLAEDEVPDIGAIVPGGVAEPREDFFKAFQVCNANNLKRIASEAPINDLFWARDEVMRGANLARDFEFNNRYRRGPKNAFGMAASKVLPRDEEYTGTLCLILLAIADVHGKEAFASGVEQLEGSMAHEEDMARFLSAFPARWRHVTLAGKEHLFAKAPLEVQQELQRIFEELKESNPELIEILQKGSTTTD